MSALSEDSELARRIAELEQKLKSSVAETERLQRELAQSRERQAASSEVLATIAGTSGDADSALQQIAETTARLFGASSVSIQLAENGEWGKAYRYGASAQRIREAVPLTAIKVGGRNMPGAVVGRNQQIHAPDLDKLDPDLAEFPGLPHARAAGTRTMCGTPLRSQGSAIGSLIVHRDRLEPFSDDELVLLQSFADQAAIALENAHLFNETKEALERQTATADILKVIAASPSDVQPVFDAIASSAKRLIGGFSTAVFRFVDDVAHLAAFTPTSPAADEVLKAGFPSPVARFEPFKLAQGGKPVQIADIEALPDSQIKQIARARGFRSMLFTPLMSNSMPIGLISVTRVEAGSFVDHHVQLLQTFADQAVIAIENARLFEQLRARTRELSEALQHQTATADVLKVISRSAFDLQTVLDALLSSACRLCDADIGTIRYEDEGSYRLAATYGCKPEWIEHFQTYTTRAERSSIFGRTILEGRPVRIPDVLADADFGRPRAQKLMGFRAALGVPLVREGHAFGVINLFRFAVGSFEDKQIELVATFADQAVIAIENVRLFEQVQAKTRDLTEALQQQTATADVLKVISRSAFDLQAVLDTLTESAAQLCNADMAAMTRQDETDGFQHVTNYNFSVDWVKIAAGFRLRPGRGSLVGRVLLARKAVQIADVLADPDYSYPEMQQAAGYRTLLGVPLLRSGEPIGVLFLARKVVEPFTDKQVELVSTFADQAVIAIENVRLFEEVQSKTRDLSEALMYQTGSANILKVIASSPTDVEPVLRTIVESACDLCQAYDAVLVLKEGCDLVVRAHHGPIGMGTQTWTDDRTSVSGFAIAERVPIHMHDVLSEEGKNFPVAQAMSRQDGCRTLLAVPMMSEGESIGAIVLRRAEVQPFSDNQITLLQTFADQAVIALGNVRLFEEVQARTRELAKSLDELRAAQDRLVQTEKLASLGQLTAGIAHEIKNPLNFVNNFSALSAELIDELDELLGNVALDDKIRAEVDELVNMLKGNFEKVVQHGNRADSIVKNMLLHSREGSGERRLTDINAIVDESLNLAYHGARAEKPGFNVTLMRDLDPSAGMAELYPQEITRVLLNLISNGFYAAHKRKEASGDSFEPTVSATTRALASEVEIRIRDNGTGIPAEVREKIFNPFFTTKPAGEGTGLGLSMSHDIIVKQHGGRIDVETEPEAFTEFIITLPRIGVRQ
ncbi:GAF domain-containing protein [Bradyrhizobium guangdongense]|uniref:histidine kinase n=1 Tax=Bradyrhizobium guangdongense TaxID=1325090 RepID=A0A410VG80_9BRAD|nr:GAF domain-containing protein [Bradyrhizobium guangdongense]QAU42663.1 histidine kinase [Bradyrhizobium guangdongense]QOZ59471.1 histidine kinase [Bradyrhizobium guangdongense]GGI34041.1 sensor histidine kinase [Bradyrhizobium guangdongense]